MRLLREAQLPDIYDANSIACQVGENITRQPDLQKSLLCLLPSHFLRGSVMGQCQVGGKASANLTYVRICKLKNVGVGQGAWGSLPDMRYCLNLNVR